MNVKTDDELNREKEAVQKMIGAKSAMEAAISRIQRLESALRSATDGLDKIKTWFADGVYVSEWDRNAQTNKMVTAKTVINQMAADARAVL
jgi:hypothetical protein